MKNKFNFLTAVAVFTVLFGQAASADDYAADAAVLFSAKSPAIEHALRDMQSRGLKVFSFNNEVEQGEFKMWDNQHEKNRIKKVSGVLAGNVLFLTDDARNVAKDLDGVSQVHLVMSQAHQHTQLSKLD